MTKTSRNEDRQLIMEGIHVHLTPGLQETIRGRFETLVRHNDYIMRCEVRLQMSQTIGHAHLFKATGRLDLPGPDLYATEEGTDAYAVLDSLAAKLDHLLEKRHGLRKEKRHALHPTELEGDLPKVPEAEPSV